MSMRWLGVCLLAWCLQWAAASDRSVGARQGHGFAFEDWVAHTFFPTARQGGYTDKWDIPAHANLEHGGIAVNPKATQFRQPVGLGDALRQYDIAEPFLLVLGYWEKRGDTRTWVKAYVRRIEPEEWRALWHPIQREDLARLDAVIKDRRLSPEDARQKAQEIKARPPFTEAVMTVNPKIDSKTQRRLQCSLSYAKVVSHLGMTPEPDTIPQVFGIPVPQSW